MRLIAIGDVHGCLEELKELLDLVEWRPMHDQLVFLGDLVDRGPDSVGTLNYVHKLWDKSRTECIMGNHDEKLVRWAEHEAKCLTMPGYKNPMKVSVQRLEEYQKYDKKDLDWLKTLPYFHYFESHKLIAVHAGFQSHQSYYKQDPKIICRVRYLDETTGKFAPGVGVNKPLLDIHHPWQELWPGPERVVHGHMVFKTPVFHNTNVFSVDTGCCYGGYLTALIMEEDGTFEFQSVKSKANLDPDGFDERILSVLD